MEISALKNQIKKKLGKSYIEVGKYSYGTQNITIHFQQSSLIIGKFCSIADNVHVFLGGDHSTRYLSTFPFGHTEETQHLSEPIANHPVVKGDVIIGNDVWIGSGVTLMSGVSIGDGAVIAARSHVVSNVPPYSVYGGNPARFIKLRFSEEVINSLLELKWWNFPDDRITRAVPFLTSENFNLDNLRKSLLE